MLFSHMTSDVSTEQASNMSGGPLFIYPFDISDEHNDLEIWV